MVSGATFAGMATTFRFDAINASMALVASGSAGAPSDVENLIPLYSGGLWDAVKLMAPSAFDRITSYDIAGVGAGSAMIKGFTPPAARTSAAIATKRSPMYLGSLPTMIRAPFGFLPAT